MVIMSITIGFDSKEEQAFVEENVANLTVMERWVDHSGYWTEFDATGCEPHDVSEALEDVMDAWCVRGGEGEE